MTAFTQDELRLCAALRRVVLARLRTRRWYKSNADKQQAWREANPKKVRAIERRKRIKHGAQYRKLPADWKKANPDKVKASNHKRRNKRAVGSWTAAEWETLKRQYSHRSVGCWKTETELKPLRRKLVLDHIVPLSKDGLNHHEHSTAVPRQGRVQQQES